MNPAYWVVKKLAQAVSALYFRRVHVIGRDNIPKEGPIIICCNHSNQFIDAVLLASYIDRRLSFTIAASSFSKPVIGSVARSIEAIPVKRPEDNKVKGIGKVMVKNDKIIGVNTQFVTQGDKIGKGWSIMIGSVSFSVKQIIDETNLSIAPNSEFNSENDKEYDYNITPKTDNSSLFKEAYEIIKKQGSICIFPEGTSHDRTDLIKLKAGIAFMSLGALSDHICENIQIVPIGLNYFKADMFRSQVTIEIGKPFEVPTEWGKQFKDNKREVTEKLLNEVESRMKAVKLCAPTIEELRSVLLFRKVYVPQEVKLSPTEESELNKRFIKGYQKLKNIPECEQILKEGISYIREIDEIGVSDKEILNTEFEQKKMKRKFIMSTVLFFLSLIFVFPGLIIITPFILYIRNVAEKERLAALAKNPNKIKAKDIIASVKVSKLISVLPFIFILWLIFFYWFSNKCFLFEYLAINGFLTKFIFASSIFPIYIYLSCIVFDYFIFCYRTVYSRTLFFVFPDKLNRLKEERIKLGEKIGKIVEKYINNVDPAYDNNRIIEKADSEFEGLGILKTNESNMDLVRKDTLEYLEKRASKRVTKKFLLNELNMLASIQSSFKIVKADEIQVNGDNSSDEEDCSEEIIEEKSSLDKKNE